MAYSVIKNNIDEGKEFYEMLRDLKKANSLLDSQKKKFLELLVANVDNFRTFMSSQAEMFEKSCSHYLDGLSLDDVNAMIEDDQYGFKGSYVSEPDKYYEKVQKAVLTYKSSLEHRHGTQLPHQHIAQLVLMLLCLCRIAARMQLYRRLRHAVGAQRNGHHCLCALFRCALHPQAPAHTAAALAAEQQAQLCAAQKAAPVLQPCILACFRQGP